MQTHAANLYEFLHFLCRGLIAFKLTLIVRTGSYFNCGFASVIRLLSACSAPMDANLLNNIHKLFSERIDIFSSVEFNKVSPGLGYSVMSSSEKIISHTHTHTLLCCRRSL